MKHLVVTRTVVLRSRIPVDEDHYPGMTPEQAREYEKSLGVDDHKDLLVSRIIDADFAPGGSDELSISVGIVDADAADVSTRSLAESKGQQVFTWTEDFSQALKWLDFIGMSSQPFTLIRDRLHVCTPKGCKLLSFGQSVIFDGEQLSIPGGTPAPIQH